MLRWEVKDNNVNCSKTCGPCFYLSGGDGGGSPSLGTWGFPREAWTLWPVPTFEPGLSQTSPPSLAFSL